MGQFKSIDGNFKKHYGELGNIIPKGFLGQEAIKMSKQAKVGASYDIALVLTREGGLTLGGSSGGVVTLNSATAGAVSQASVQSYESMLPSYIPFAVMNRGDGGEESFVKNTSLVVKNNIMSHQDYLESILWYGQSASKLGYVSYATATYRGVSFTNGGGALSLNGSSVTLTAGVNTTSKWILLAPGQFASGSFCARVGTPIQQCVTSSNAIVGSGTITAVDSSMGAVKVSFTPTAASAAGSHYLCFPGMEQSLEAAGVQKILSNTGSLFGIDASIYELWRGTQYDCASTKLTFAHLQAAQARAVNQGLDGDLDFYVNPRSFSTLATDQAALRHYDSSYKSAKGENGFAELEYVGQAGVMKIIPHRYIKEGDAFGMSIKDWMRPGAQEISMKVNGADGDSLISLLENQNAYRFMSYQDSALLCVAPCKSIYMYGINDESAT